MSNTSIYTPDAPENFRYLAEAIFWMTSDGVQMYLGYAALSKRDIQFLVRYPAVNLPQNAVIVKAYLTFRATEASAGIPPAMECYVDTGAMPDDGYALGDIICRSTPVAWTPDDAWEEGGEYDTPNLRKLFQAVVDDVAWASGNPVNVVVAGYGALDKRAVDAGISTPELTIEWLDPGTPYEPPDDEPETPSTPAEIDPVPYVAAKSATVNINMGGPELTIGAPPEPFPLTFFDQILIQSRLRIGGPGDSGSALLAVIGGQYKVIGLVFAGSTDGTQMIANHIDTVAELLNIEAWDGSVTVPYTEAETITVFGKQFVRDSHLTAPVTHVEDGSPYVPTEPEADPPIEYPESVVIPELPCGAWSQVDLTDADIGYVVPDYEWLTGVTAIETYMDEENIHDGDDVTAYQSFRIPVALDIEFPSAEKLNRIDITAPGRVLEEAPAKFRVFASATGNYEGEEVELLDVDGTYNWLAGEIRRFDFENDTAFLYYRILFTANNFMVDPDNDTGRILIAELVVYECTG